MRTVLSFSNKLLCFLFADDSNVLYAHKDLKIMEFIAELSRTRSARIGALWVTKFGKLSIRENLVMT